jgi:hypothetical protein
MENTTSPQISCMKLKDLKIWLEMLPNEFLEYDLVVAANGIQPSGLFIYEKEYVVRGFDVDDVGKQILFLHAADDTKVKRNKIIV